MMRRWVPKLAGLVWLGIGVMLFSRGLRFVLAYAELDQAAPWKIALAMVFAVLIGAAKGRFVLSKAARRNKRRIETLKGKVWPWNIFALRFYPLIGLMMAGGFLLRLWAKTGPGAQLTVGAIYCGIGGALFVSAFAYWAPRAFEYKNPWTPEPRLRQPGTVGVILANLGTPTAPTPAAVARFLREFLMDPRVIEIPRAIWFFILNLFIVPLRRYSSAQLYRRIFTEEGSPLLFIGRRQAEALQARMPDVPVELGMRYGQPSIEGAMARLKEKGCERILVVPAYPQYSGTTSASIIDAASDAARRYRFVPALRIAPPYPADPGYIKALARTIEEAAAGFDYERLVLSYHSIPTRYVALGDPYPRDCVATTEALVACLRLKDERWLMTYQSIFGRDRWLGPQTESELVRLAQAGVKRVLVACPGFLVDCLESVDEIGHEAARAFKNAGGEELRLVPCLNDHPAWIGGLARLVDRELSGWRETAAPRAKTPAADPMAEAPRERVEGLKLTVGIQTGSRSRIDIRRAP